VDIWHYHGHIAALGSRLNGKLKKLLRVASHYAPVSDRFMIRELGRLCGTGTLEKGRVYSEGSIFALLFENMEYKNYLKSNRVLVHTEVDRRRLLTGKMKKRQIVSVLPGVDTKYFSPARRSREFSEKTFGKGAPVIGYIGRLDGLKGPDLFLEAAYLLLREMKKARFVIVGEGPGEDAVRTLAAGMGLRRHITFLPVSLQNYSRIVAGFDVLVSTSIEEKIRLVLFEALASGVPVAAFNLGGIAEYITHGREGVLAPYGDSRTLAFRLADFLEGDHGDLSGRLRKRALEHDWTRVAGSMLNIYEDLIARGR
jgi:glycosyltransferase involved in cell wall biosynthesis